jgi:ubiquitin carboxyl-terminal hydrolase 9/24
VKEVVVTRLKNMTEKELKEIDKESVGRVLNDLRDFFYPSMNENETAELIESNYLNIALRFLKSTYLEKRLKGISDIKLMIERIEWGLK